MSATTIGTVVSRLRIATKTIRQDSFVTDKQLYSLFLKYAAIVIRKADDRGKLLPFVSIFETLDWVELEECDWVEAGCSGIKSYRTFRKTKLAMPMFSEGSRGPMVRSITSLDGSIPFQIINLDEYVILSKQKNFRFNKTHYCWFLNDHLYFPDIDYPAIRIEGMFEDDISEFKCCYDDRCKPRQEQSLNIPDYMLSEIEGSCLKELLGEMQIPSDNSHDNININR